MNMLHMIFSKLFFDGVKVAILFSRASKCQNIWGSFLVYVVAATLACYISDHVHQRAAMDNTPK